MCIMYRLRYFCYNLHFLFIADGVTGAICPVGHYCPQGTWIALNCPVSTYMDHTGAAICYDCPEGFYCSREYRADICPQGYYCPPGTGTVFQPCPIGRLYVCVAYKGIYMK